MSEGHRRLDVWLAVQMWRQVQRVRCGFGAATRAPGGVAPCTHASSPVGQSQQAAPTHLGARSWKVWSRISSLLTSTPTSPARTAAYIQYLWVGRGQGHQGDAAWCSDGDWVWHV